MLAMRYREMGGWQTKNDGHWRTRAYLPLHVRAQTIGKVGNEEYTQLLRKIDIDIFSRP